MISRHVRHRLYALGLLALGACRTTDPDDGPQWVEVAPAIDGGVLLAAAALGQDLVFVGGDLSSQPGVTPGGPGYIVRLRDGALCREDDVSDNTLWWIAASSDDEWYAVGEAGTILHERQGERTDESVQTEAVLYGIFDQGQRVVAVGGDVWNSNHGEVWLRDAGGSWSALATDLPGVVFKVWDRWLVGDGVAWTLEGDTLVEHFPPDQARLLTVHGRASDDVWAVGGSQQPVLLHWTGSAWESIDVDPRCFSSGLNGVWVSPQGEVWLAGFFGGIGMYRDGTWECPERGVTSQHFHAVVGHQDSRFFAGGDLFGAGDNIGTVLQQGETAPVVVSSRLPPC
ncbi:MAG: hypothetical protein K0V04_25575 [Deltaproteobacteria bacterium]|nr:hypothetical protein [Deltaproteobacteria bacterium]